MTAAAESMAKTNFESVDDYLASQPPAARRVLERVRSVLREALPRADEVISYQIAAYKQDGGIVIYFAGWKTHYSLYPATELVVAALGERLAPHLASKGTLRFPLSEPVPARLIARIATLRAKEVAARKKAKASAPKKRPAPAPARAAARGRARSARRA